MRNSLILVISFFISLNVFSAHIVGGEVYYDTIGLDGNGNMQYQITIELFRDCDQLAEFPGNGTGIWSEFNYTIFDQNNNVYDTYTAPFDYGGELPLVYDDPCVEPPSDFCIESALYIDTVSLPIISGDYTITYQVGNWDGTYINFQDPGTIGMTITSIIPGTDKVGNQANNSVRYSEYPQIIFCLGQELSIPPNIIEEDGDSLAFKLCDPLLLNSQVATLQPNPNTAPPYQPIPWEAGFNANSPFGTGSVTNMNVNSGVFTATPTMQGNFVARFCVEEWRNGELINTHSRTFGYTIVECESEPPYEIEVIGGSDLDGGSEIIEGCGGVQFVITRNDTIGELALGFSSTGDAVAGVNFDDIADSVYIPEGVEQDTIFVNTLYNPPEEGDLEVTVYLTSDNPCNDEIDSVFTSFTIIDYFEMEISIVDSINICADKGESFEVVAEVENGIPPYFYQWNNNVTSYPNNDTIVIDAQILDDNFNPFGLVVYDQCGFQQESGQIKVFNRCRLAPPNVITANNDGVNDLFIVKNLEQYDRVEFKVLNRWGELVYSQSDYDNKWDGRDKRGNRLTEGVYFYTLQPTSDKFEYRGDGELNLIHGFVHIVRDN